MANAFTLSSLLGEGADEDDGNPLEIVVGFELFAHLVAVHLRHIDVQQDQVRGIPSRAASSASLPPGTGRTLYPRSLSMPASTWRLAGVSSTDQDAGGLLDAAFRLLRIQ